MDRLQLSLGAVRNTLLPVGGAPAGCKKKRRAAAAAMLLICLVGASHAGPRSRPKPRDDQPSVTGKWVPGVELFDRVMLTYLEKIGCTAATLAISNRGSLVVSRGYG
jgi:hypothetical protein